MSRLLSPARRMFSSGSSVDVVPLGANCIRRASITATFIQPTATAAADSVVASGCRARIYTRFVDAASLTLKWHHSQLAPSLVRMSFLLSEACSKAVNQTPRERLTERMMWHRRSTFKRRWSEAFVGVITASTSGSVLAARTCTARHRLMFVLVARWRQCVAPESPATIIACACC